MKFYPKGQKVTTEGLGDLKNIPAAFNEAACQVCGAVFDLFKTGARCSCYQKHKMKATKVICYGERFDSLGEARRYSKLVMLQKMKIIYGLELQPTFKMSHQGKFICSYKADFHYYYGDNFIVEDVKGYKTPIFNLKRKMMAAFYPNVNIYLIKP